MTVLLVLVVVVVVVVPVVVVVVPGDPEPDVVAFTTLQTPPDPLTPGRWPDPSRCHTRTYGQKGVASAVVRVKAIVLPGSEVSDHPLGRRHRALLPRLVRGSNLRRAASSCTPTAIDFAAA